MIKKNDNVLVNDDKHEGQVGTVIKVVELDYDNLESVAAIKFSDGVYKYRVSDIVAIVEEVKEPEEKTITKDEFDTAIKKLLDPQFYIDRSHDKSLSGSSAFMMSLSAVVIGSELRAILFGEDD